MVSLGCIFLSAFICLGQITANMILIAAFFCGFARDMHLGLHEGYNTSHTVVFSPVESADEVL